MTLEEQEQFARDVVSKEILLTEARKMGIDKLPEVTQAATNAIQRKAWEVYQQERVKSQVKVTEEAVRDLYEKQRYSYHLLWIFLRSQAQSDEVMRRLKAGEDFGAVARAASAIAVIWGMPVPETTRVVQIEPGPIPTFTASTPAATRSAAPS